MTTKKAATPKKATTKKAPVTPKAPEKPAGKVFISVGVSMYHPFKGVSIPSGSPGVKFDEVDSWLESQIDRGLVKEL